MSRDRKPDPQAAREQPTNADLAALYKAHAGVGPDHGLDRIIQARAEQALQSPARRRPAPWIAGLATAGALVLAIGIAWQLPDSPSSLEMELPAPATPEVAAPQSRSAPPPAERAAAALRFHAPAAEVLSDQVAELSGPGSEDAALAAAIENIRALHAQRQSAEAMERLGELLEQWPLLDLPEDLAELKARLGAPPRESDCTQDPPPADCP